MFHELKPKDFDLGLDFGFFNLESLHMFNKILMSMKSDITVINISSTKLEYMVS